jgi:cytochrome c oxidase cbb3-type subunit III
MAIKNINYMNMKKNIFPRLGLFKTNHSKYVLTGLAILLGFSSKAQSTETVETINSLSLFSIPLFNVLLGVIVMLIIVIAVLGGVLKNVAAIGKEKSNGNSGKTMGVIAFILFISSNQQMIAQTSDSVASISSVTLPDGLLYLMLLLIGFEVLIIGILISCIKLFTKKAVEVEVEEPSFFEMMNASVAIEKESEIMLDHNYDGIIELDNDLPPWWKYGFYLTIVFAVVYMVNHHVIGKEMLQADEYNTSIQMANIAKEEYQKKNANNVNENSVTMLTDQAEIAKGAAIYKENCFACHGKLGEGGVGPNLTDDYWLHGGSIKNIFSSIKYGWPDKGMKAWQADFSPVQIHQLASYIKTLKGSNPVNAKVPQGELYTEVAIVSDSLKTDSTALAPLTDSLKVVAK